MVLAGQTHRPTAQNEEPRSRPSPTMPNWFLTKAQKQFNERNKSLSMCGTGAMGNPEEKKVP